jgi:protein-disulfide isomerase
MRIGLILSVLAGLGLSSFRALAQPADDMVVAEVAGRKVTYAEIRKKVGLRLQQMDARHQIERRKVETEALRELVEQHLFEAEAKKRGVTVEALLEAEVTKKVPEPTDSAVQKVYDEAKDQIGAPLSEVKPRIVAFLKNKETEKRRGDFLESLRVAASVKESLPPMNLPVIDIPEGDGGVQGPADAPVKIVVFSDFECPFCGRLVPTLSEILKKYPGKIRIAFRDFPLEFHSNARKAAEAARCANDQGKFWPYHDRLFEHQDKLGEKDLLEHAKALELDGAAFEKCLQSGKHKGSVERDYKEGTDLGITGTPAAFVNGMKISGAQPLGAFTAIIDAFLSRVGSK